MAEARDYDVLNYLRTGRSNQTAAIMARAKQRAEAMSADMLTAREEYLNSYGVPEGAPLPITMPVPVTPPSLRPNGLVPATLPNQPTPAQVPALTPGPTSATPRFPGAGGAGIAGWNPAAAQPPAAPTMGPTAYQQYAMNMNMNALDGVQQQGMQIKVTDDGMIAMDLNTFKTYASLLMKDVQATATQFHQASPNYIPPGQ